MTISKFSQIERSLGLWLFLSSRDAVLSDKSIEGLQDDPASPGDPDRISRYSLPLSNLEWSGISCKDETMLFSAPALGISFSSIIANG
jgi:hypothetical protein